jgi:Subtilase family
MSDTQQQADAAAIAPDADQDPAAPMPGEISETADLATARMLANIGISAGADSPPLTGLTVAPAGNPLLPVDYSRAQAFLQACETSVPRVTYGLGKKVPSLSAIPGRDFTQVDCSGFVRETIRRATNPTLAFPDGSVVQHDWVKAHHFGNSSVAEATRNDGVMRIAFLRPQDVPSGIGHVVLILAGKTLESHGGVGPDSRPWNGNSWQAKTFVYQLAHDAQVAGVAPAAAFQAAPAAVFTVHHGRRYRATVTLSGFEQFAGNDLIAGKLTQVGFADVTVSGSGGTRIAQGLWTGPDTTAQLDPHLSNIVELPADAVAAAGLRDAIFAATPNLSFTQAAIPGGAAPAILSSSQIAQAPATKIDSGKALAMSNVFTTASLPAHHEGMLVVKMRDQVLSSAVPMTISAVSAMSSAQLSVGLSALSYYERAGMIKRVLPFRPEAERVTRVPGISAVSALTFALDTPPQQTDRHRGVNFIELQAGQDSRELQAALASDPNVLTVSQVPIRYLAAHAPRRASRAARAEGAPRRPKATPMPGAKFAAVPPSVSIMWNLLKIFWDQARARHGFHDADAIKVGVLDTGIDFNHPELKDQIASYHHDSPDSTTVVSDQDIIGHGTHVSGTIAALVNGDVGVKGICKCSLNVWKIFADTPTYEPAFSAFSFYVNPIMYRRALADCLDDEIDVINLSIGGPAPPDPTTEGFLFEQLLASGVTVCAAMGNDRAYGSPTSYPAAIPGVIAVGATGLDDGVTTFSNSGQHIALAAPGSSIWSTLPTYPGATGFAAVTGPDGRPQQGPPISRDVNYAAWDGTSMATPHVTGCAALLLANKTGGNGKLSPDQVKKKLMASADKVPGMNGADFSVDYGAGRLNLLKLLQ